MLNVLTQARVDIILDILWVKGDVLAHLLVVEVGEFLELFDSKHLLLLVISVCKEPDGLVVLVSHYVKDSALLGVFQVQLFIFALFLTMGMSTVLIGAISFFLFAIRVFVFLFFLSLLSLFGLSSELLHVLNAFS